MAKLALDIESRTNLQHEKKRLQHIPVNSVSTNVK